MALVNFDVFSFGKGASFIHGTLGCVVMTLGLLQPINAFLRPHPDPLIKPTPFKRRMWEILHKGSGWSALLLSLVTIFLGASVSGKYRGVFVPLVGVAIGGQVLFVAMAWWDGKKATSASPSASASTSSSSSASEVGVQMMEESNSLVK